MTRMSPQPFCRQAQARQDTRTSQLELCNCTQYTAAQPKGSIMQLQSSPFRAASHQASYQQKAGNIVSTCQVPFPSPAGLESSCMHTLNGISHQAVETSSHQQRSNNCLPTQMRSRYT